MKPLFLALALMASSNVHGQVRLEPLQEDDIEYGCGCSFHAQQTSPDTNNVLLMWGVDGPAKMRINGKLHTFQVSEPSTRRKAEAPEQIGDRVVYRLKSSKWSVTLDCRAKMVCKGDDESCEATTYAGQMSIVSGKARKTLNIQGICGC